MEIKFRVWDGKKMWYSGDPLLNSEKYLVRLDGQLLELGYDETGSGRMISVYWDSDCTYNLFTGLKDRNGKEIYDGDIVTDAVWIRTVKWEVLASNAVGFWISCESSSIEVIGNIHENPELLDE